MPTVRASRICGSSSTTRIFISSLLLETVSDFVSWQRDPERRAGAGRALDPQPPAVQLDQRPRDRQPQARALVAPRGLRLGSIEALKDQRLLLRGDARPVVGHTKKDLVRPPLQTQANEAAAAPVLLGVAEEIEQRAFQSRWIALPTHRLGRQLQLDALAAGLG